MQGPTFNVVFAYYRHGDVEDGMLTPLALRQAAFLGQRLHGFRFHAAGGTDTQYSCDFVQALLEGAGRDVREDPLDILTNEDLGLAQSFRGFYEHDDTAREVYEAFMRGHETDPLTVGAYLKTFPPARVIREAHERYMSQQAVSLAIQYHKEAGPGIWELRSTCWGAGEIADPNTERILLGPGEGVHYVYRVQSGAAVLQEVRRLAAPEGFPLA